MIGGNKPAKGPRARHKAEQGVGGNIKLLTRVLEMGTKLQRDLGRGTKLSGLGTKLTRMLV